MESIELRSMGYHATAPRDQAKLQLAPFHQWSQPKGDPWADFYRIESSYLVRFPNLADFHISGDGTTIVCHPTPHVSESTTDHLYLNQIKPLALSLERTLVFHASAVVMCDHAIAFVGQSRRGKSTLATSLAMSGYPFLTDDALILEESEDGSYQVKPSHPSVRLWSDSHRRLIADFSPVTPDVQYTSKVRLPAADLIPYCHVNRPLQSLYFLGAQTGTQISISSISEVEAVIELIKHAFVLDIEDQDLVSYQFSWVSTLVSRTPCYWLNYPRRYDSLPSVHNAIRKHVAECLSMHNR